jgi:hypothetical protein
MKKFMLKIINYHLILFCCCAGFILSPYAAYSASITLEWVPGQVQPLADVIAGYKIYYGKKTKNYTYPPVDAGNLTSYTVEGLDENEIYYFAVVGYTSGGEESDFSAEVSTFNEFTGTAQIFSRKIQWDSCEIEEDPSDTVAAHLSFNYLPAQGSFIFEPEDTRITCNAGTFIQRDDNTIEAECVKKGPLGILTRYRFIFDGFGNASLKDPLSLRAEVFTIYNQGCPAYVIEMENLLPVQE